MASGKFCDTCNIFNNKNISYTATNTIRGEDVSQADQITISILFDFTLDEKILILYNDNSFNMSNVSFNNTVVGLTNYRIFKVENGMVWCTYIKDIVSVKYINKGLFYWNKLICETKAHEIIGYGIYYSDTCKYFCDYIRKYLIDCEIIIN